MKELQEFDALTAEIAVFVAPVSSLAVKTPESAQSAIETAQELKRYTSAIEDKRKVLVGPLNARVKAINDYCKQISAPLVSADSHVRGQLNAFAAEQESIRRAEHARIEKERQEAERIARETREAEEKALLAKQEAEAEKHAEAASFFGVPDGDIDKANEELEQKQWLEWETKQAELKRIEAMNQIEAKQKQFDANQSQIKGTRGTWKVRIIDLAQVPKEFLTITLNEKAAVAVGKTGTKISGLEFYEDFSVSIGAKTRLPKIH